MIYSLTNLVIIIIFQAMRFIDNRCMIQTASNINVD